MAVGLSRTLVSTTVLLAIIVLWIGAIGAGAELTEAPMITIDNDGVVTVEVWGSASPGLNEYPAPAPAVPATIEARLGGELVPAIYTENSIYIATSASGDVYIHYIADVTEANGVLEFNITYNGLVRLYISPGVVLLTLPQGFVNATSVDGALILYIKGPSTIQYTLVAAPAQPAATATTNTTATTTTTTAAQTAVETTQATTTAATATQPAETAATTTAATTATVTATETTYTETQTTTTTTQAATTTATAATAPAGRAETTTTTPAKTTTTATTTTRQETMETMMAPATAAANTATSAQTPAVSPTTAPQESKGGSVLPLAALVAVVAVVGGLVALRRSNFRGGGNSPAAELRVVSSTALDEVDRLILRKLEEHGGSMLQSQLLRETGIPKTTLWRHVRRLAEQGYIRIEKEGKSNRLTLLKKPEDGDQQ